MLILGIDTATRLESVAVVDRSAILAERSILIQGTHSVSLLRLVAETLRSSGLSVSDLDGIAVSLGPGSFTGLRVGVSTVKALAYSAQKAVVGVSTLEALARIGFMVDLGAEVVCPMLDARRGEVFASVFERKEDGCVRVTSDILAQPDLVVNEVRMREKRCLFLGDGADLYCEMIREGLGRKANLFERETLCPLGSEVARLGEKKLLSAGRDELCGLSPVYVKPSYVESTVVG
jgi:tRNA threonylcarbamoyladenosine biosynthesis protein TsaB